MIKFENTEVMNFEGAFRGMRNPLNSWDKADSKYNCDDWDNYYTCDYKNTGCNPQRNVYLGPNDLDLAQRLIKAGPDHRKFLRQIFVSVDITSWATWWAEFDTYKVATVRNSCSKMHKIHVKEFSKEDFTTEGIDSLDDPVLNVAFTHALEAVEYARRMFNETKDKRYWRALLELLPHGYNIRATITLNYETLRNIYGSRRNHKLDEWSIGFMEWIDSLPYVEELIKS